MDTGIECEERFKIFKIQSKAEFHVINKWAHIVVSGGQHYKSKISKWIKQNDCSITRKRILKFKLHKYFHLNSHLSHFSSCINFWKQSIFSLKTFHAIIFSFSRGHLFRFWRNLSNICSRSLAFRKEWSGGSTIK